MNDLSLRLLRAFTTLAAERQFRKAAEKFNVSQSAFSQMISRLEEQVGVPLVDRDSRNMSLTPEGELLLPLAEKMQGDADALLRKLRDSVQHKQGDIAISALPTLTMAWLPTILANFRELSPATRVRLFDFPQLEKSWEMLRARHVDFVVHAAFGHSDEFESIPLFEECFYIMCRSDHPLARRKRVWLKDLEGEPYIHFQPSGSLGKILNPMLAKVRIAETGLAMDFHTSIASLISNGFGVSAVPGLSTWHYRDYGLVALPLHDTTLRRTFAVMKRRGEVPMEAAATLLDLIISNPPPGALPVRDERAASRARRSKSRA
ncbi:MAG TPA: LysR family transcriptional regulator [Ramlibacter sp.]|nr:LysR family transcriptional regulator [Ramlibacter sp.]